MLDQFAAEDSREVAVVVWEAVTVGVEKIHRALEFFARLRCDLAMILLACLPVVATAHFAIPEPGRSAGVI